MEIVINSRVSNEIGSPSPFAARKAEARTWRICALPRGCCRTQHSASCRQPAHAAADFLGQRLHGAAAPRASAARCEEQRDATSCRRSCSPMWEPCSRRSRTRGARCLLRRPETPQSNFPGPAAERWAASLALLHAPSARVPALLQFQRWHPSFPKRAPCKRQRGEAEAAAPSIPARCSPPGALPAELGAVPRQAYGAPHGQLRCRERQSQLCTQLPFAQHPKPTLTRCCCQLCS